MFNVPGIVKVTNQVLECVSDVESDGSDTDSSSEEECEDQDQKQGNLRRKAVKYQVADVSLNTEDYFLAQSASVHTSDRTLNRLKNPRLSQEAVDSLMETVNDPHSKEKLLMLKEYHGQFTLWNFLLKYISLEIRFVFNCFHIICLFVYFQ